ncbi:MAG: family 16 glycoside hydrolase, partial [Anaerolineaceae bacterium]
STLGPPSWIDTYANGNNWPQGNDQFTSVAFDSGFMKLTALTNTGDGWRLTYPTLNNFYLEAKFQTGNCEQSDHFGIIFRVPDINTANQGYFYGIQCDGKYFLKVFAENKMTSIVYAKASTSIFPGKDVVNRLGIMAEGDKLSLYVNGTLVKEISDTHFERGGFGIFVGSDVVKNLTVWVDEIAYWSLP